MSDDARRNLLADPRADGEPAPTRGRPKDPSKQEALLDAARELFLTLGPDAMTINQVIGRAKVARATLYANYPDKDALLEAVFARESCRIVSEDYAEASLGMTLEDALTIFGERLLAFLADPDMMTIERLIPLLARSHPTLAPRLFAAGPGRGHAALSRVIERARDQGRVAFDDVNDAVSDLVGLWQGFLRVELMFGQRVSPTRDELLSHVQRGIRQFMRLYAVQASQAPDGSHTDL